MEKVFNVMDLVNEIVDRTNLKKDDIIDELFYSFNTVPEKEREVLVHLYFLRKSINELLEFMDCKDEDEIMELRNKGVEYVIATLEEINSDEDYDESDSE
jgi:hypothetical protein